MDYIIETKHVTKTYKNQTVLKDISINVERDSVYGLLGPNGAGKSTLLKLITQVIQPSSGEILFDGKSISTKDLKEIGAIIETPAIYPNLTAYENLQVLTTLLKIDETKISEVLDTVGLTNTDSKLARDFSHGMKQRLGIAMALINNPRLLILDETTNGLDTLGIEQLRELNRSFSDKGITVIISSHILSEVQQLADHIAIINKGHLSYEGINNTSETHLEEIFMEIIRSEA